MLKLAWGALFGNPLYALLGLGAVLLISNSVVGIKAYQFGADRQLVLCQKRVDVINDKIRTANLEIERQAKQHAAAIEAIEKERETETAAADAATNEARQRVRDYEDAINLSGVKCLPTADDIKRLH